jgi:hypothetical protein
MGELHSLPQGYAATRNALHRVAEEIVAPARKPQNEIALTQTPGGFGTPEFEHDGRRIQVRVEGDQIVVETDGTITSAPITNMAETARLVGEELLPGGMPDDESDLGVDSEAAAALGAFYELSAEVLETFKGELPEEAEPSSTNLWPEHFDIAFEAGSEEAGSRANYGASPGDENHPEPYLYVGPWSGEAEGELWNAKGFTGAEMDYAELVEAHDPRSAALEFFRKRYEALAKGV